MRRWTAKDDTRLYQAYIAGWCDVEIARWLRRTTPAVKSRRLRMGWLRKAPWRR